MDFISELIEEVWETAFRAAVLGPRGDLISLIDGFTCSAKALKLSSELETAWFRTLFSEIDELETSNEKLNAQVRSPHDSTSKDPHPTSTIDFSRNSSPTSTTFATRKKVSCVD